MNKDIKILIVDDDPDVIEITTEILKLTGCRVLNAATGSEGMSSIRNNHPDIVLLDVVLPDIPGPTLCREIKSDPILKNTYVVLFSGMRTSSLDQADGLDIGADGYIARPISNRELIARINVFIRIIRAERDRDRLIEELKDALSKLKVLSGLLPICSHCKKIRDDKGYWNKIEAYIEAHSDAGFSHSICPECAKAQYPDLDVYDGT